MDLSAGFGLVSLSLSLSLNKEKTKKEIYLVEQLDHMGYLGRQETHEEKEGL